MARLIDDTFSRGLETARILLGHPKFSDELAVMIRRDGGADKAVEALIAAFGQSEKNRFELSVKEQLKRFRAANEHGGWGFTDEDFERLAQTVPEWPGGKLTFRSLRIRLGEGSEGVARTFEAHAAEAKRVHDPKFWRWERLRLGLEYLRLLAGDETHKPCVEWITFDANANRQRNSITAVRGADSLADELIVVVWMFPELIKSIDYDEIPGMFAGGYELNVPERDDEPWQSVPIADFNHGNRKAELGAHRRSSDYSNYSVPSLRE